MTDARHVYVATVGVTDMTDISTMGIQALRDAWRIHDEARGSDSFGSRGGKCNRADKGTAIHWTRRAKSGLMRSVRVRRKRGKIHWRAIDEVPGTKVLDETKLAPLASMDQLELVVDALLFEPELDPSLEVPSWLGALARRAS